MSMECNTPWRVLGVHTPIMHGAGGVGCATAKHGQCAAYGRATKQDTCASGLRWMRISVPRPSGSVCVSSAMLKLPSAPLLHTYCLHNHVHLKVYVMLV
jgi:hypothetical protein